MRAPSVIEKISSLFQAFQCGEKCLKYAAITALVVSTLSLIGGIISFFGVLGVQAAGIWTASSFILTAGFLYFVIQSCRRSEPKQGPKEDPSLSIHEKETMPFPETLDGVTKEEFAKYTSSQVKQFYYSYSGEVMDALLSPMQVRKLFYFGNLRFSISFTEERIHALKPKHVITLDQSELVKKGLTAYQIFHLDYSRVNNSELANLLLESEHSQITSEQVNNWVNRGLDLNLKLLRPAHIQGLFRSGGFLVKKEFLTHDLCEQLDDGQISNLIDYTDLPLVNVSPDRVKNRLLTEDNFYRFFHNRQLDKERLWLFSSEILNKLLLNDVQIRWTWISNHQVENLPFDQMTERQFIKVFPLFRLDEYKYFEERMGAISIENIEKLLVKGWSQEWLMYLPEKHIKLLDFSKLSVGQKFSMFLTYNDKALALSRTRIQWVPEPQRKYIDSYIQANLLKNDESCPQEDPSLTETIKQTVSLPETVDGLTKEDFAKLTPEQVKIVVERGENVSKLLSRGQFRALFEFLISPEIKGSVDIDDEQKKELIPALKPEQLARFDSDELIECFHLFTPYQIWNFDYSKVENANLANLFLKSEYSQITDDQILAWLDTPYWRLKLSGHQIAKLPFDRITDDHLGNIFPPYKIKKYQDFEQKLMEVPNKIIQNLLYDRKFERIWLMFLPENHLKALDFSRLSSGQIFNIFPFACEEMIAHSRRRFQWLSDTQRSYMGEYPMRYLA